MIEIIYNEEEREQKRSEPYFQLPKNIRQIGEIEKRKKIYIEDYAVTFINQYSTLDITRPYVAVMMGRVNYLEGTQYIFVNGVLEVEDMEVDSDRILFTDRVWTGIYENIKRFFVNQEIVGWFFSAPGYSLEVTEGIFKAHVNHFGGNEKILLIRDNMEKEEGFFAFEGGNLKKQSGYYIYYEKNESMQNYMIHRSNGRSIEQTEVVSDRAIQNFRKIIQEKQEENHPRAVMSFLYAASTFLIITVLVIGITLINSHDKMKNMEETLASISKTISGDEGEEIRSVSVENVEGRVDKLGDNEDEGDKKEGDKKEGDKKEEDRKEGENDEDEGAAETKEDAGSEDDQEEQKKKSDSGSAEEDLPETPDISDAGASNSESAPKEEGGEAEVQDVVSQIPPDSPLPETYVIQQGDTLLTISKAVYGSAARVDDIIAANGIDDIDKIYPGQKIVLPE